MATDTRYVHLRTFADDQLLFDEEETKAVLIFFFPDQESQTRALTITNQHRNFAQGLMVMAVDATYAFDIMGGITKIFYSPTTSIRSALRKLGQASAKHWFKHASEKDLIHAQISESVRIKIRSNFVHHYNVMLQARAMPVFHALYINPSFC